MTYLTFSSVPQQHLVLASSQSHSGRAVLPIVLLSLQSVKYTLAAPLCYKCFWAVEFGSGIVS